MFWNGSWVGHNSWVSPLYSYGTFANAKDRGPMGAPHAVRKWKTQRVKIARKLSKTRRSQNCAKMLMFFADDFGKYWQHIGYQPLRLWIKSTIRSILEFRLALRRKRQEFFDCTPLINFKKLLESYWRIEGKVSIIPCPPNPPPLSWPEPQLILISSQN